MTARVLLLAGTAEARRLAAMLKDRAGITASLAGVTDDPLPYPVATRTGGFGGVRGLTGWMQREGIETVIDATHPFAARMPWHAAAACAALGVPRLRLLRREWRTRPGWIVVASASEAADALPAGARVLLTTGATDVAAFAVRRDVAFTVRSISPPATVPGNMTPLRARPPFTLDEELATLREIGASHLVSKNSGGLAAKLDAADRLGVRVVMIRRPPRPDGPTVETPEAARAWLDRLEMSRNRPRRPLASDPLDTPDPMAES